MLKFRVEGQKLTWENPDEVVVAGTKKYLECYFEFDGDAWSGFEYIEAFFKNGRDKPIRMLLSANRIWKENGLCLTAGDWSVYLCATTYNAEKEEIEKQITSSSVSIRVLAHGQFEDAQNSFESPEIANQYIAAMQVFEDAREKAEGERVEAENARNVFEEYNPDKTYVKGNKVSYEGSSYVLTADSAMGTNPTDGKAWLLIAKKGDDANVDKNTLVYRDEVSVLPETAKTGDVYRIAETIYEKDTIYIPCTGAEIGFGAAYQGDDEYTTRVDIGLDSLAEQICSACEAVGKISIVSDLFADNVLYTAEVVGYNASKGYLEFKNESEYFLAVLLHSKRARYIISDELIEWNRLSEYKIANYFKGDCVVYENGTWKKLGNDEVANIYSLFNKLMIEIDNKNDSFAETIDSLNEYKVDIDLANVDNEVFRAKAEEAGVGGDAGLAGEGCVMKFMHEVSALPETANDGEVYSLSPWTNVGEFFDASGTVITEHTIYFGGWSSIANFLYDDVQRYYGCTYKFIIGNREFIFKECGVSSAGPDGFEMSVNCTEQDVNYTIPYNSTVEVYRTDGEPKDNDSYVRFNGKWIKL